MRRKLTVMLVTAAVLALIVATAASSMLPTYEDALDAEVNSYEKLSKTELLDAMKTKFVEENNTEALIPIASIFHQRRDEYTADELLALIEDNSLPTFLRITFVQVLNDLSSFSDTDKRISDLLNKDIPNEIKQSIIAYFGSKGGIEADQLVIQAQSEDRYIAYQAIKRLNQISPRKAYTVSKDILQDFANANEGQIKGAINVLADKYAFQNVTKNSKSDLDLMYMVVDTVLAESYSSDVKDSVIFALIDMHSIEAMEYVVRHDNIDELMRKCAVDDNYDTMVKVLENNPTTEQIEFIIECMELNPVKELADVLEKSIKSNPAGISRNITPKRISDVLENIRKFGEPAIRK